MYWLHLPVWNGHSVSGMIHSGIPVSGFVSPSSAANSPRHLNYAALRLNTIRAILSTNSISANHKLYLGKVYLVAGNTYEALQTFRQGMILGGSPELERMLDAIGTRKSPVVSFLSRDNLLNKYLGIILGRFGLR